MPPARSFDAAAKLSALGLAPNGSELAAALQGGRLDVFSSSGKALRSCAGAEGEASSIRYTGDGGKIVAGCGKSVSVFDAATGARLRSWAANRENVEVLACSRDGSLIATATTGEPVKLWKEDGSLVRSFDAGPELLSLSLSLSGDLLAAGSSDTKIRIFDLKSGQRPRVLELPMASSALAFSADGRALAAGCVDGAVALYDSRSGESKGILGRHSIPAGAAVFSPDGRRLACVGLSVNPWGADAEAKVWDLASRKETSAPIGVSFVNAIGFTPASRPLVVSARDRTISVWEL